MNMENLKLYNQIESLPQELKREVEDFVQFLLEKSKKREKNRQNERTAGLAQGMIKMKPGFEDPLEDFKEYME